jgi:hypothetical protein
MVNGGQKRIFVLYYQFTVMKLLVLLLCSFTFISAKSQQLAGNISDVKFFKDSVLVPGASQTLAMNDPKYQFLFETEKGKVFESPVDHMRCLAPKFSSNMPVAGSFIHKVEPMPNAAKDGLLPPPLNKEK